MHTPSRFSMTNLCKLQLSFQNTPFLSISKEPFTTLDCTEDHACFSGSVYKTQEQLTATWEISLDVIIPEFIKFGSNVSPNTRSLLQSVIRVLSSNCHRDSGEVIRPAELHFSNEISSTVEQVQQSLFDPSTMVGHSYKALPIRKGPSHVWQWLGLGFPFLQNSEK